MPVKRKIIVYSAVFIILIAIVLFIYQYRGKIRQVITPFFMALVIAYVINPLVIKLERRKISRRAGILLIYLFFSLLTATIIVFIIPEIINNTRDLMNTLPDITARYQNIFNRFVSIIQSSRWSEDIKNTIYREMQNSMAATQNLIMNTLRKSINALIEIVAMLFNLILAMIIAYYFIKDAEFFKGSVLFLAPRKWRNGIINTGREISLILSNFIQGQLLTAIIVGAMETAGLLLVKVKYPLILGLIGGAANIIPYFGPVIGAIPAVAVALIQSPVKALWVIVVFVIVQQVDNAFISPKIIEGRLGLHPVATILAVLIGGEFFGIIGMLVSVPAMAILKVIAKRIIESIV